MPPQTQVSPIMQFVPFIFIFGIFYFLIIRPQKQREKEHKALLSKLAKNDEVVTSSGIHGTIVNVKDTTVIIRVDDNAKIEVDKAAVAHVKTKPATSEGK
ncbi:MAG TPA: preprotein translocase subunit YajC [Candidatus Omnitrophota bacterium]|mgnify:FL=1|nr:preprotein translocase subunit YajC [Candidatus Omnitrophota bacterium]HNQ50748.1 preprotein translocase subunit YajC [Candidatus Omnitrophota bacterium]HQO37846.1 preprotein translocase subunit YajC [Candidatus Omnitrophota bacterium]HQQ06613.1 preprotein translocase subunit YajC [Candidatus Omnitrophota bacterium]